MTDDNQVPLCEYKYTPPVQEEVMEEAQLLSLVMDTENGPKIISVVRWVDEYSSRPRNI